MSDNSVSYRSGITYGPVLLLTIILGALKLTGVVAWSWSIVFLPLIISASLTVAVLLVGAIVLAVAKK